MKRSVSFATILLLSVSASAGAIGEPVGLRWTFQPNTSRRIGCTFERVVLKESSSGANRLERELELKSVHTLKVVKVVRGMAILELTFESIQAVGRENGELCLSFDSKQKAPAKRDERSQAYRELLGATVRIQVDSSGKVHAVDLPPLNLFLWAKSDLQDWFLEFPRFPMEPKGTWATQRQADPLQGVHLDQQNTLLGVRGQRATIESRLALRAAEKATVTLRESQGKARFVFDLDLGWLRSGRSEFTTTVVRDKEVTRTSTRRRFRLLPATQTVAAGTKRSPDLSEVMLDSMKRHATQYQVSLPPGPKVGVWWEHSLTAGLKTRSAIVDERNGNFLVEQELKVAGVTLVQAWLVDPSIDVTQDVREGHVLPANVIQAWIGIKGRRPVDRAIMKPPEKSNRFESPKPKETKETITLAGQMWQATAYTSPYGKTWLAQGTSFILKGQDTDGKSTVKLSGWGEDAKPALLWD